MRVNNKGHQEIKVKVRNTQYYSVSESLEKLAFEI